MNEPLELGPVLAEMVVALSAGTTVTVAGWIKDAHGEAHEHVRISDDAGHWMEVRFYGGRYWMFTESGLGSSMQFLAYLGSDGEQATENHELMAWVARVCISYLTGDVETGEVAGFALPRRGQGWRLRRTRRPSFTIVPPNGESITFIGPKL